MSGTSTRTRATAEGTKAFARRATTNGGVAPASYRSAMDLAVSSIGLGTYLGDADDTVDVLYTEAVVEAIRLGCNVLDTAINYRFQRSERAIGSALARLFSNGSCERSNIVVSTKGGYVPFDGSPPATAGMLRAHLTTEYFDRGICTPVDMACRGQHCMAPGYLANQLDRSLANLGLSAVDVYYVHNPETQLPEVGREEFERRMRAAFEFLEVAADDGRIGVYGTATWNGYRVAEGDAALSLGRLAAIARDVGGPDHRFRAIQLPYNLAMTEAYASPHQRIGDERMSVLEAAGRLGLTVFTSASILQSQLASGLPEDVTEVFACRTDAQRALQFARSTRGVTCALVGMAHTQHVRENLDLLRTPPAAPEIVDAMFVES